MFRQLSPVVFFSGCGLIALATLGPASEIESPFLPPVVTEVVASGAVDPLASVAFAGVVSIEGQTSVYLRDTVRGTGLWFRLGESQDGVCAEQYDREREAVLVRAGSNTRWFQLPRAVGTVLPVARLPDGTVDWTYMNLSEKGKETEAMHLMQDIMFASMAARSNGAASAPAKPVTGSAATISPVR